MSSQSKGDSCQPWQVGLVEGAGRGLFASRDIKAGEVVLQDWPVVEGPLPDGGDSVCVMCLGGEDVTRCPLCSLPVCRSRQRGCTTRHKAECDLLTERDDLGSVSRDDLYTIVAVLRMLWQIERDNNIRSQLEPLMDHREILEGEESKQRVVQFLVSRTKKEESLVWRCLGLLQTNGVTSHSTSGVATGHGLYPVFSITNHSCISNTRHATVEDTFCLLAVVDIKAGEEITTSYKSTSLGSIVRRPPFKSLWNFDCLCRRCTDPTELGTFASAIRCGVSSCPGHCLPLDCLNYTSDWSCAKCGKILTSDTALQVTEMVQAMCPKGGSIEQLETCLEKILEKVHPRHYIAMQIKRMLMLMYGNCSTHRFDTMTRKDLLRKSQLCREYMAIFNILEPGLTKWKGRVCEELARTLIKLEGVNNVDVLRLIAEANKCKRLDSQQEQAAFHVRISSMMMG